MNIKSIIIILCLISIIFLFQACKLFHNNKPILEILSPENDALVNNYNLEVRGNILDKDNDVDKIKVWIENTNLVKNESANEGELFYLNIDLRGLSAGKYIVSIQASDKKGNLSNLISIKINYTQTPPNIDIKFPADGEYISSKILKIEGIVYDPDFDERNVTVNIIGEETLSKTFNIVKSDSSSEFSLDLDISSLKYGEYSLLIYAKDSLNNFSEKIIKFYYLANSLDLSFGENGVVKNNIYSKSNFANDMVIQSDNKIIICGTYFGKSGLDIYIARYNSNGTVDASFGNNGIITIDNGVLYEYIRTIAVQKDGKIIVAGDYNYEGTSEEESSKVFLSRFNIDGTPDLSFGNNGKVSYVLMAGNELFKIAIQEDEKIIAVGTGYGDFKDDFYIARFNKNGTLDLTFGDNGKVIDFIGSKDDIALEIALQNDGKIIIAGYFDNIKDKDIFISRYENNGMLDLSFGNKGKIISKIGSGDDLCYSIKIQEDGKLVVAGKFMNEIGNYDIFLSRFNIDGTPDISFGENGITTTAIGSDDDIACTLLIQEDGKIISAGYYKNRTNFDIFLLRYTANGSIDSSFGINGKFVAHIEDGEDEAYAIAFQGNKKIVIFGQYSTSNEYFKAYLIRLLL